MDKRSGLIAAAGIAISAVFLWLAARRVDWRATLDALQGVRAGWLALGMTGTVAGFAAAAFRWRTLLSAATREFSYGEVFDYTMIGQISGLVLPQRLGDVVKIFLIGRRHRVSRTTVTATVLVERVSDVVMLIVMGVLLMPTGHIPPVVVTAIAGLAAVTLGVLTVLWLGEARWVRVASPVLNRLPHALDALVRGMLRKFAHGVPPLRANRSLATTIASAAVLWIVSGFAMSAYVAAFGLHIPWYAGFVVVVFVNFGALVPAAPGSIGVYHYLAVMALTTWTDDRGVAFGFAVLTHALNLILIALVGAVCLARQGLSLRGVRVDSERLAAERA